MNIKSGAHVKARYLIHTEPSLEQKANKADNTSVCQRRDLIKMSEQINPTPPQHPLVSSSDAQIFIMKMCDSVSESYSPPELVVLNNVILDILRGDLLYYVHLQMNVFICIPHMYFSHCYFPNRPYGRNEAQNIIKILHVIVVSFTTFRLRSLPAPPKVNIY